MQDLLTKNSNNNNMESKLKREILETATKGQECATRAQVELEYQGEKLSRSLGNAKLIADQATSTGRAVDQLISVKKASRTRKILRCCYYPCCCCRSESTYKQGDDNERVSSDISAQLNQSSALEKDSDIDTVVQLDSLKVALKDIKRAKGGEIPNWCKTLAPPLSAPYNENETWYRLIDASLTYLQQVAEDMSQSLDEQKRMAQMLTIYLNYGVDQVLAANENLNAERNLF